MATHQLEYKASVGLEGGREVATIGFFHDLREALRMKQELEKTQIQLLQAEKMTSLGKLAAGVAHQLNNPLGGIILYTQLILEEYELDKNLGCSSQRRIFFCCGVNTALELAGIAQ